MKKAAMFGLDARIALAIFGALSVISGAALYSAIQQAKTVSIVAELNEVSKAIEAFMLDTGRDLGVTTATNFYYGDLVNNASLITGWNGPYITEFAGLAGTGGREYVDHPIYGNVLLRTLESNLGGSNYSHPNACTTAPCFYWVQLNGLSQDVINSIDTYVDGSIDGEVGRVRYLTGDASNLYLQGPLLLKQP
jgi:hypothetical protein